MNSGMPPRVGEPGTRIGRAVPAAGGTCPARRRAAAPPRRRAAGPPGLRPADLAGCVRQRGSRAGRPPQSDRDRAHRRVHPARELSYRVVIQHAVAGAAATGAVLAAALPGAVLAGTVLAAALPRTALPRTFPAAV